MIYFQNLLGNGQANISQKSFECKTSKALLYSSITFQLLSNFKAMLFLSVCSIVYILKHQAYKTLTLQGWTLRFIEVYNCVMDGWIFLWSTIKINISASDFSWKIMDFRVQWGQQLPQALRAAEGPHGVIPLPGSRVGWGCPQASPWWQGQAEARLEHQPVGPAQLSRTQGGDSRILAELGTSILQHCWGRGWWLQGEWKWGPGAMNKAWLEVPGEAAQGH